MAYYHEHKKIKNTQNSFWVYLISNKQKYWYVVHLHCRQFYYVFSNAFEKDAGVSGKLLRKDITI